MCGILGIYNTGSKTTFDEVRFKSALLTMAHRGPDSHEIRSIDNKCILGHVRLSIIDLSDENSQPFQVDERFWIVFNGEVYNYVELRNELINAGYKFRTTGDTEVILRAYQYWGEECVLRFNGMWAFAIYDKMENRLFCSRDRFGVKPFYYVIVNGQFLFSSEIKALINYYPQLKQPNYSVISNFCRKSIGAQTKETWFMEIFRLEPACNSIVDSTGIKSHRYWNYPNKTDFTLPFEQAVKQYRELLADSIRLRMRSDVPVGFTLSSGIDSSSIVCLLRNQYTGSKNTYTASFSGSKFHKKEKQNFSQEIEIDEPAMVRKMTEDLDLYSHIIEINYGNYLEDLSRIIRYLESGHASPAIFPLDQILVEAKKKVTVVLEGQGADELMGGYIIDLFPVYLFELFRKLRFRRMMREFRLFKKIYSLKIAIMLLIRQSDLKFLKKVYYKVSGIDSFFKGELKEFREMNDYPYKPPDFDDRINKLLFKAHTGGLVSLLHYGDAVPMSHSIESRQPFMDYRLVEFVFRLPSEYKIYNGMGKYLHREAMKGIVPDYIIDNPIKLGFDSPLSEIFLKEGEGSPLSVLLSDRCLKRGLFSKKAILKAFREQKEGKRNNSRVLFRMLSVEFWFREFIDPV